MFCYFFSETKVSPGYDLFLIGALSSICVNMSIPCYYLFQSFVSFYLVVASRRKCDLNRQKKDGNTCLSALEYNIST